MFKNLKISSKIVLLVTILVTLSVIALSIISFYRTRETVRSSYLAKLELITENYEHQIDLYFKDERDKLRYLVGNDEFIRQFNTLDTTQDYNSYYGARNALHKNYLKEFARINQLEDIFIIDREGTIVYQNSDLKCRETKFKNVDNEAIDLKRHDFYINAPIREGAYFYNYVSLPLLTKVNGMNKTQEIGQIICKFKTANIFDILYTDTELINKRSFEVLVYKHHHQEVYQINADGPTILKTETEDDLIAKTSKSKNIQNNTYTGIYSWSSEREKKTYLVKAEYYKTLGVGMMVRINVNDAYYELDYFNLYSIVVGAIVIIVALIISYLFARMLTFPMLKLKKILSLVSKGVLPRELETPLRDEVGDMIMLINKIVLYLKGTAEFATHIGKGKFDTDFRPKSNKDILGKTLVDMRKSLQNADEKDNIRNWVVTGVAEIGEILRNNTNLELLGYDILEYTCLRIGALQGAFYIIDNDKDIKIKSSASYAFNKKKHVEISFAPGSGLVGQVYMEKKPLIRTEIPKNYPSITSGLLGEQKPNCIAIFPLITNDIVYGIMEFASFQKFDSGTLSFLEEISEGISRTIFYIKVNEHTKTLLTDSQDMSQELQHKQSELENNANQMAQSQVELSESNTKLEHQVSEVNRAQSRTEALLKNASEVIMIFDKENNIKYVSPSAEKIIGYREEDLIGSDDLHLVDRQFVKDYQKLFSDLVNNKIQTDHLQLKYYKKTGDKIWLEVTGTNLLADPSVNGIVFNFQDITERIRAQEEERKKGQMQALSENSLDIIIRIGAKDHKIYYANPIIQQYTGINPSGLINSALKDTGLHKIIWSDWKSFAEKVKSTGNTHTTEMVFPTEDEHMVMEVNAMPELDDQNEIESVLIVSHDITEKKRIENEIKSTNVKIQDSINYAENIQRTIIPDEKLLTESFSESLIVFKPKDIVSGDFPWYFKKDNTVFLAAVDCTGHGVPGAMISFVGYFLLNNIVQHNTHCSAGEILDLLDREVTETFKQDDEKSTIKDGMDMSLCKVDLSTGVIEYAGAQRPLYVLKSNGIIVETKGSKFPIGGGSAYNKSGFTNSVIKTETGDALFIFSDGLPDQFGGDNGTQKFGPRRIKQMLEANHHLPLNELNEKVESELAEWMKESSQTDDIILLGFRL